ncbi:MAG: hypothetical protein ACR2L1_07900 [Pyrinomonadaceae bacterium]
MNNDEIENEDFAELVSLPPPELLKEISEDERYLILLTTPLKASANYKPKFGQGGKDGMSYEQFHEMYSSDPFYSWIGLDSPLMYAAHKAAGGMTSVYRQLGIGSQWILNQVIQDHLGLTKDEANWSYEVPSSKGKTRKLSLDARIETSHIKDKAKRSVVENWIDSVAEQVLLPVGTRENIKGVVIEARQGYKSKDSKRQNADISNASNAYANLYIPVLLLFSTQIDGDVAHRYKEAQWLLLNGSTNGTTVNSTYAFCRDVVGYDLQAFFTRNSPKIKKEIEIILEALLSA